MKNRDGLTAIALRVAPVGPTSGSSRQVTYYVSGASVPGEGELKCIDWIKLTVANPDESVVIIGGDADLVLQGMALSQVSWTRHSDARFGAWPVTPLGSAG